MIDLQGAFNVSELNFIRSRANDLFENPLVTLLDLDEVKNAVVVGVESMEEAEAVKQMISELPVPEGSILVEEHARTPINAPDNTDRVRPLRGGLQIAFGGNCTRGFVAER